MTKPTKAVETIQAVILLEGTTIEDVSRELVLAGMSVLRQYDPRTKNYVGDFESKEFQKHFDSWLVDNNLTQVLYYASRDDMDEIEYKSQLESVPTSTYKPESNVLVLGPFTKERIDYHVEGLVKA